MSDVMNGVINFLLLDAAAADGAGPVMGVGGLAMLGIHVSGIAGGSAVAINGKGYDPNGVAAFQTLPVFDMQTQAGLTSIIADGTYMVAVAGMDTVQAVVSSFGGGAITAAAKGLTSPASLTVLAMAVTASTDVATIGGAAIAMGQHTMAQSLPVVVASNQSDVPVNLDKVGGVALVQGQAAMAASVPVVLASDQSDVPANITQVGGAALAFGQAAMAASLPVTVASDQAAFPVTLAAAGDSHAFANINGGVTDGAVVAATPAKKIRVVAAVLQAGAAAITVTFNSKPGGAGVAITSAFALVGGGNLVFPFNPEGWFETVAGEALTATTGASANPVGIQLTYALV